MKKLMVFVLIMSLFAVSSFAKEAPEDFKIAVWDKAPATDVVLATKIMAKLNEEGYSLPDKVTKLYSEVDHKVDEVVVLVIYEGDAEIIVGAKSPAEYVVFSVELSEILEELGISHGQSILSTKAPSDLLDLFDGSSKKETPDSFKIAVWDKADASDVMLAAKIATALKDEGYDDIKPTKLFSGVDAKDDKQVIAAIYEGDGAIVVGDTSPAEHVAFSVDLSKVMKDLGISHGPTLLTSEVPSSQLMDLFGIDNPISDPVKDEPVPTLYDEPEKEPVMDEPEDDTDCDGCLLDEKCYNLGYRKAGKYCSDSGEFESQLASSSNCDNNFECSSNVCVDSQCVSGGLISKILNWFRNIFGG